MDRATWADRYFDMETSPGRTTYVLKEKGAIEGYLTVQLHDSEALAVDEVAVRQRGRGYGDALVRWADTLARQSHCREIRLLGLRQALPFYEKHGFKPVPGTKLIKLDDEEYTLMARPMLHHL